MPFRSLPLLPVALPRRVSPLSWVCVPAFLPWYRFLQFVFTCGRFSLLVALRRYRRVSTFGPPARHFSLSRPDLSPPPPFGPPLFPGSRFFLSFRASQLPLRRFALSFPLCLPLLPRLPPFSKFMTVLPRFAAFSAPSVAVRCFAPLSALVFSLLPFALAFALRPPFPCCCLVAPSGLPRCCSRCLLSAAFLALTSSSARTCFRCARLATPLSLARAALYLLCLVVLAASSPPRLARVLWPLLARCHIRVAALASLRLSLSCSFCSCSPAASAVQSLCQVLWLSGLIFLVVLYCVALSLAAGALVLPVLGRFLPSVLGLEELRLCRSLKWWFCPWPATCCAFARAPSRPRAGLSSPVPSPCARLSHPASPASSASLRWLPAALAFLPRFFSASLPYHSANLFPFGHIFPCFRLSLSRSFSRPARCFSPLSSAAFLASTPILCSFIPSFTPASALPLSLLSLHAPLFIGNFARPVPACPGRDPFPASLLCPLFRWRFWNRLWLGFASSFLFPYSTPDRLLISPNLI